MKFRYLKSLIPAALSLSLTFGMVSCVGDLDISPIDPQVSGFHQTLCFIGIDRSTRTFR